MKTFKKLFLCCILMGTAVNVYAQEPETFRSNVVADEGAWCWFADPRALHYENAAGTINATYIGYIDVHGNVKATQYDWKTGRKTDVLVRSYFQPDDHNNPTFVVLPDERVMIFYTRHTDEAKIWYRISRKPGDISALGEEKFLATANNTTYPSPFILSDDPTHIYLCWRGINWHPTIARLTMPDSNDNCSFDFGPKQIVQSSGARPYAKYQSNGKDKIYLSYTTGHPDNEMPDWLYFNVIDINHGNGPILRDIKGNQLKTISSGVFNVNKSDNYANTYPNTIVDRTANIRNWVWQITLDKDENPVIAYPHIDNAKTTHVYWYARWTDSSWRNTWVQYGGHAFHQNWNSTELCYSGGMAIDPENINDLYLSIPTKDGVYNKDGVYEIWKYTINDEGAVSGSQQLTSGSEKNNVRPFIIPGSKNAPLRLAWMNGDYYYWMVKQGYPKGYPTGIRANYTWEETLTTAAGSEPQSDSFAAGQTLTMTFAMNESRYEGTLFTIGSSDAPVLTYALGTDYYPVVTINGTSYKSQNRLLTSDDWATMSTGTSGDNHPTKITTWTFSMTFDGQTLTTYRNGLVDQVIETTTPVSGTVNTANDNNHLCLNTQVFGACASPMTVAQLTRQSAAAGQEQLASTALAQLQLPAETRSDLVLPAVVLQQNITWTSSNEKVISNDGVVRFPSAETDVTLTAHTGTYSRDFTVKVYPRDIAKNLRYETTNLDLTANTASGFTTNTTVTAPQGLLRGLRSFTFLLTVNAKSLTSAPRFYDFGSGSANSIFLRANPLSAGVKYNGGTTTMVNATSQLSANKDYKLAVTFDAATHTTTIYIDGQKNISGTANQVEPYQLEQLAADVRNYIGRTQWWDGSYAADNVDFMGTINDFRLYDVMLTRKEICQLQDIAYEERQLPTALVNADFEDTYSVMSGSGVSNDRAIYVPKGWTIDYTNRNENDLTALKSGDKYFSNFFASLAKSSADSQQSYWVRQNWGTSTITLLQEVLLPEGHYTLNVDVWKSGLGGDVVVQVKNENGAVAKAASLENKTAWQSATVNFDSDGEASTTVLLSAVHTSNGSSKIIGFDNLVLTRQVTDGITTMQQTDVASKHSTAIYDLQGRRMNHEQLGMKNGGALPRGLYIVNGNKVVVK